MTEHILYTWIHLSDIHFGHGGPHWRADQGDVVEKLIPDVRATLQSAAAHSADALLLTGDIAFKGAADEFDIAEQLVRDIVNVSGGETRVYAVGGNHDVVRTPSSDRSSMRLLASLRAGTETLDDVLDHQADVLKLEERFAGFHAFCENVGSPISVTEAWSDTVFLGAGIALRFVGWNTGLLCNDNDDRGRLSFPIGRSIQSVGARKSNEIIVVLTHHDLDWLQEATRSSLTGLIWTRGANVHLSGHEHSPEFTHGKKARGRTRIHLSAGAVHADRDRGWAQTEHYYSVVTVVQDDGGIKLKIYPRRFSIPNREWGVHHDAVEDNSLFNIFPLDTEVTPTPLDEPAHPPSGSAQSKASPASTGPQPGPFVEGLKRLGRRRTTFPTDLTTAQVVGKGLVVPARKRTDGRLLLDTMDQDTTRTTLVLGDPGSGKTILAYSLALHWYERGLLPVVIDLRELEPGITSLDLLLISKLQLTKAPEVDSGTVRLIVDGLDEALATLDPHDIFERMARLQSLAPVVAFCRRHEYSTRLAPLFIDYFDDIVELAPWHLDEFSEYLNRLQAAGLTPNPDLAATVRADHRLTKLVTRPLMARMLTLLSTLDAELPSNEADLYTGYLNRVAETADVSLRRVTDLQGSIAMEVWRRVAWEMFQSNSRGVDAFDADDVIKAAGIPGLAGQAAFRAIETIMDVDPGGKTVSFLHYSLFEFLVAQHIAERLFVLAPNDPSAAAELLTKDLTHEIRAHVVTLLRQAATLNLTRWPDHMVTVYQAARQLKVPDRLTSCNLVVYMMSRLGIRAGDALSALLAQETVPFLRNSIQWSLAREDDRQATESHLAEMVDEPEASALNRGYLLYYYGDINEQAGPPYIDTGGPWDNTRSKVVEKFTADDYTGSVSRRLVDVFTFCDMAHARGQKLSASEARLLEQIIDTLPDDETTHASLQVVRCRLWQTSQ